MKKCLPYIIIVALIVALAFSMSSKREVSIEKTTTDTIYEYRVDTIYRSRPIFKTEVVVDTIYIEKSPQNDLKLPITQRYYSDDAYRAWVSGYKPNLDSIEVYQKTLTNTIVRETTRDVYPMKREMFLNVGFDIIDKKASPNIGAMVKFKNGMTLGAEMGLYDKSVYYGARVGIKLSK